MFSTWRLLSHVFFLSLSHLWMLVSLTCSYNFKMCLIAPFWCSCAVLLILVHAVLLCPRPRRSTFSGSLWRELSIDWASWLITGGGQFVKESLLCFKFNSKTMSGRITWCMLSWVFLTVLNKFQPIRLCYLILLLVILSSLWEARKFPGYHR